MNPMPNEIYVASTLTVNKDGGIITGQQSGIQRNMDGQNRLSNVQNIGITPEKVDYGDIGIPRYMHFKNIDSTNDVTISLSGAATPFATLSPGDVTLLSSPPKPLYIAGTGAGTVIEIVIAEE